jgi:uncharacterized membrane protein
MNINEENETLDTKQTEELDTEESAPTRVVHTRWEKIRFLIFVVAALIQVTFLIFLFLHTTWLASIAITILWLAVAGVQLELYISNQVTTARLTAVFKYVDTLSEAIQMTARSSEMNAKSYMELRRFINSLLRVKSNLPVH